MKEKSEVYKYFRNLNEQFHYEENGFERREEEEEEHKTKIPLSVRLCQITGIVYFKNRAQMSQS